MPRRRPRFSDLDKQFRESGGVAAPGSRLAGYIAFKKGETKINITKVPTAAERKRFGYGVYPFGLSVGTITADDRYAAPITVLSNAGRTSLGFTDAQLGYQDIDASTKQEDSFYPALMRVFVPTDAAAAPAVRTSAITVKQYKARAGRSYTIPFGRTLAGSADAKTGVADTVIDDVDLEDVKKVLALKANTGNGTAKATSVSFDAEVFRNKRKALASPVAS